MPLVISIGTTHSYTHTELIKYLRSKNTLSSIAQNARTNFIIAVITVFTNLLQSAITLRMWTGLKIKDVKYIVIAGQLTAHSFYRKVLVHFWRIRKVTMILKPLSLLHIKCMLMRTQGQTIINHFNPEPEYNSEKIYSLIIYLVLTSRTVLASKISAWEAKPRRKSNCSIYKIYTERPSICPEGNILQIWRHDLCGCGKDMQRFYLSFPRKYAHFLWNLIHSLPPIKVYKITIY